MSLVFTRPELEFKRRAPLAGGQPGTHEFVRSTTVEVGPRDTCDFITDGVADQIEIIAALTYVNTLGGGEVLLIEATYTIVDPINFPGNNLTLSGLGRASFIDGNGLATGENAIVISACTDCVVRNLSVQTQAGGGKTCQCVYLFNAADRFLLEKLWIINSDSNGIHLTGTAKVEGFIEGCRFLATDGRSIYIDDGSDYMCITGNIIHSSGDDGIYVAGTCQHFIVADNILRDIGSDGIYFTGVITWTDDYAIITNNTINTTGAHGIYTRNLHMIVSNNMIRGAGDCGIRSAQTGESIISSNLIYSPATTGIYLTGTLQIVEPST